MINKVILSGGFSPPDINEDDIAEVVSVLKSGWITTGPKVREFEKRIAEYCQTSCAVCLSSQTTSAEMTLRLLGIGEGDEVIVPAYTYTATASVVCHTGAKLIIIDSQPNSIEMDYDKVAKAINEKTKAIIPVDVGGIICDYDKIFSIVESKKNLFKPNTDLQKAFGRIIVLADAAHSFGATRNGKSNGSIADFTCFSFHAVKNLTTAEGGAVTWRNIPGIDNEEIFKKFELLSLHGQSKDALSKNKLGSWEYDIVEPYFKCNMTDIQAALGVSQLRRYDQILVKRKKIIEQYDNAFRPLGLSTLNHYSDKHSSSGHLYLTFLDKINFLSREEFIEKLTQKGIPSNVHYKPLPLLSAYKKLGYDIKDFPNAYNIYKKEVTLPLYTRLSDEQVNFIIDNVKDILSKKDIY